MIDSGIVQASLVKPGIVGAGLVSPYSRYFRTNDGSNDYISIPEVAFSGDFEQHYLFTSSNAGAQVLAGNSSGTKNFIAIRGDNVGIQIQIRINDINLDLNSATITFGNLNHLVIRRVSGVVSIDVNSVTQPETATMAGDFSINQLCRNSAGNYLVGILANVLMYDNGTLVRNYPINDNSNTIADISGNGQNGSVVNGNASDWELFNQQADGDWLGQELVVNGGFDSPDNWTLTDPTITISGGIAEFSSTPGFNNITQDIGFSYNTEYRTNINISQYSQGSIRIQLEGVQGTNRVLVGDFQEDLITAASGDTRLFIRNTTVSTLGVDSISVKQLLRVA